MKSIISAGFLLALGSTAALAALPPQYQRQAELVAVIEAATEAFGIRQPIDAVKVLDTDVYEVTAGECTLAVRIVDAEKPEGEMMVGARQFTAQPDEIVCPEAAKAQ